MRVLVTGAAGEVGREVVRELARHGHQVVALIRPGQPTPEGADRVHRGDCADPQLAALACADVDGVAHLAAIPSPIGPPDQVFTTNTAATHAILEAAGAAGVGRAVIASSLSVIGLAFGRPHLRPAYLPVDEDHPILAEDPYALSKQVDEMTAAMMHRRWGTDLVALRMPFVGAGERLAGRMRRGREDPGALVGDLWGYLRTEHAAEAFRRALEGARAGCHVVTVAAPDTVCSVPTAMLLQRFLPEVPLRRELPGRTTVLALDWGRALLRWQPPGDPFASSPGPAS